MMERWRPWLLAGILVALIVFMALPRPSRLQADGPRATLSVTGMT